MSIYNLQIIRAANGWVVNSVDNLSPGRTPLSTMVVLDDTDLGGIIAAALVAQKLDAQPTRTVESAKATGQANMLTINDLKAEFNRISGAGILSPQSLATINIT
jgi:hypothetical protein